MPRHTHPREPRQRHTRAHTRHHRDRLIATRERRIRDEQLLRRKLQPHYWGWDDTQPPPTPLIQDLRENLHEYAAGRWFYLPIGDLPHYSSLEDRLIYTHGACGDYWDCSCGHCRGAAHPSRRARGKRETQRLIDEQLRERDPYRHTPRPRDCAEHDWQVGDYTSGYRAVRVTCRRCRRRTYIAPYRLGLPERHPPDERGDE